MSAWCFVEEKHQPHRADEYWNNLWVREVVVVVKAGVFWGGEVTAGDEEN